VADVHQMNVTPEALELLRVSLVNGRINVGVRTTVASKVVGNGIGRPMAMWDVDLQVGPAFAPGLRFGDLGVVVHGSSPQPGHGPGVTVLLSGPAERFTVNTEGEDHAGLGEDALLALAEGRMQSGTGA
jgi:hypothetical protein